VVLLFLLLGRASAEDLKATDPIVRLPPLLVESTTGQPWILCETEDFEILSRCSKRTTEQLVRVFSSAHSTLDMLLPRSLRFKTEAPQLLIFYDAELWPKARHDAIAQMLLARTSIPTESSSANIQASTTFEIPASTSKDKTVRRNTVSDRTLHTDAHGIAVGHVERAESAQVKGIVSQRSSEKEDSLAFFSNLRLTDADMMATFAIVSGQEVEDSHSALTYDAVSQILTARVPKLPPWFISGFLSLYSHTRVDGESVTVPKISEQEAAPLRTGLRPLRDLVYNEGLSVQDPTAWLAQTELFVRWGLDPTGQRREGFWQFVERTAAGFGDESEFARCFGITIDAASADLANYVSGAKRSSLIWRRQTEPKSGVELRDASRTDIARIRGEWERLEVRYVRRNQPSDENIYLVQARHTVQGAIDRGDKDPRLLATFGLLLLDAGDEAAALPILEESAASSVNRPRVYFELAKLRFEHALDYSHRDDGLIEETNLAAIIVPLTTATKLSPPLLGVYELLADVWAHSVGEPNATQLADIEHGLTLFSSEPELCYRAAILYKKLGNKTRADELALHAQKYSGARASHDLDSFRKQLYVPAK